jgi:hypothetical protein
MYISSLERRMFEPLWRFFGDLDINDLCIWNQSFSPWPSDVLVWLELARLTYFGVP